MTTTHKVIVIGGSFSGLSAAIMLGRASVETLVIDSSEPRNRFSASAHAVIVMEGKSPLQLLDDAMEQISKYPSVTILKGVVTSASKCEESGIFTVETASGDAFTCERLILACGVTDNPLPLTKSSSSLESALQPFWGRQVLHCPYCHGFEVRQEPLVVMGSHPMILHTAALLKASWSEDVTVVPPPGGNFDALDKDKIEGLKVKGVRFHDSPVEEAVVECGKLRGLKLENGTFVALSAMFVPPMGSIAPFITSLGVELAASPFNPFVRSDSAGMQQTTVQGVFACGDVGHGMPNVPLAIGSGSKAGVGAHQSLVFPDMVKPLPRTDAVRQ